MYCAFSHLCNEMAIKINYALDYHEFVCQRMNLITLHPANSQTDSSLYKLSVQQFVYDKKTAAVCTVVLALSQLLSFKTLFRGLIPSLFSSSMSVAEKICLLTE